MVFMSHFTDWDSIQYLCTELVPIQSFSKDFYQHLIISFIFTVGNSSQYTCTDLVPFRSFYNAKHPLSVNLVNFTDLNTFSSNPVLSIVRQLSLLEFLQFKSVHTWLH